MIADDDDGGSSNAVEIRHTFGFFSKNASDDEAPPPMITESIQTDNTIDSNGSSSENDTPDRSSGVQWWKLSPQSEENDSNGRSNEEDNDEEMERRRRRHRNRKRRLCRNHRKIKNRQWHRIHRDLSPIDEDSENLSVIENPEGMNPIIEASDSSIETQIPAPPVYYSGQFLGDENVAGFPSDSVDMDEKRGVPIIEPRFSHRTYRSKPSYDNLDNTSDNTTDNTTDDTSHTVRLSYDKMETMDETPEPKFKRMRIIDENGRGSYIEIGALPRIVRARKSYQNDESENYHVEPVQPEINGNSYEEGPTMYVRYTPTPTDNSEPPHFKIIALEPAGSLSEPVLAPLTEITRNQVDVPAPEPEIVIAGETGVSVPENTPTIIPKPEESQTESVSEWDSKTEAETASINSPNTLPTPNSTIAPAIVSVTRKMISSTVKKSAATIPADHSLHEKSSVPLPINPNGQSAPTAPVVVPITNANVIEKHAEVRQPSGSTPSNNPAILPQEKPLTPVLVGVPGNLPSPNPAPLIVTGQSTTVPLKPVASPMTISNNGIEKPVAANQHLGSVPSNTVPVILLVVEPHGKPSTPLPVVEHLPTTVPVPAIINEPSTTILPSKPILNPVVITEKVAATKPSLGSTPSIGSATAPFAASVPIPASVPIAASVPILATVHNPPQGKPPAPSSLMANSPSATSVPVVPSIFQPTHQTAPSAIPVSVIPVTQSTSVISNDHQMTTKVLAAVPETISPKARSNPSAMTTGRIDKRTVLNQPLGNFASSVPVIETPLTKPNVSLNGAPAPAIGHQAPILIPAIGTLSATASTPVQPMASKASTKSVTHSSAHTKS